MKLNKLLNIILILLSITVIALATYAFVRPKFAPTPSSTMTSSSARNAQTSSASAASTSSPPAGSSNSQSAPQSQPAPRHDNSVIVTNGQNFSYRAAQKLGLIPNVDTETSVQDFYANCQDDGNGGFTYNGKRYAGRVIQDGHQNEYHCNIEVYPLN